MDEGAPRWGIWIDVEGFGNLWSGGDLALRGLQHLTRMIFSIGTLCYPDDPDRLFAHQIGDAFYVASDFHEPSLDRCAAIAVALMRGMTAIGCVARATIAEGDIADYAGCRPTEVQAAAIRDGESDVVRLGSGLMTLQAVMGQGLIDAVVLDKVAATKGAVLLVAAAARERLSLGFLTRPLVSSNDILAIDWVHSASPHIDRIAAATGFGGDGPAILRERIEAYVGRHRLPPGWCDSTLRFAGL
jgi:hypothetical protein